MTAATQYNVVIPQNLSVDNAMTGVDRGCGEFGLRGSTHGHSTTGMKV